MIELKKFFFLCALRLINDKDKDKFKSEENGKIYFRAPFPAPFILNKAWDAFILYSENYMKFCDEVFGGFLDKPEYKGRDEAFEDYDRCYRLLFRKR